MTLSRDQVIEVLQQAQLYDKRTIGETDILAWSDAALRGRWATRDFAAEAQRAVDDPEPRWSNALALEAVKQHYAASREWIMPADITGLVRRMRETLPPPPAPRALPRGATPSPAETAAREEIARLIGGIGALPEDVRRVRRSEAERVREHAAARDKAMADLDRLIRETTPNPDTTTEGA